MEDAEETEAPDDEVFINVENSLSRNSEDGRHTWLREARSLCGDDLESLASEAADDFPITPRLSEIEDQNSLLLGCLLYTSPSPRDATLSRMPSSA